MLRFLARETNRLRSLQYVSYERMTSCDDCCIHCCTGFNITVWWVPGGRGYSQIFPMYRDVPTVRVSFTTVKCLPNCILISLPTQVISHSNKNVYEMHREPRCSIIKGLFTCSVNCSALNTGRVCSIWRAHCMTSLCSRDLPLTTITEELS